VAGVQGLARLRDADLPVPTNLVFDSFLLKWPKCCLSLSIVA
jgi:hypothetical protein